MKKRKISYLFLAAVILFGIFLATKITAFAIIEFVSPTPNEGIQITNTNAEINASIIESNLSEFKFNWNEVNYTFYDNSLILMMNFDNISALGENNTYAVDMSKRANNGTAKGSSAPTTSGRYNGAFEFDGAGDYISIPTSLDFNLSNKNWTMSMWINPHFNINSGYQALLVKRLSAFSQNDWGLWDRDTNSTEFIYGNNSIIKVGAVPNNSEWSQLVLTRTAENVTTISFTNNSNLINKSDNDGIAYNGTDLFLTLDNNISRYDLSGNILSSSITARCGFNTLNYGGAFYKDGFIYTIIGNAAPPWEVYVLKIDPADFSCDQIWNVAANLSYLGNAIFYMNGSWFIGETGIPSIATKKIIRFNDNFEKLNNAIIYPGHENVGFQDATVYKNKVYVTDHSGNIYVLSYQSDGTLKEEYKLGVSTGNTYMEGITTVGDTFFMFEADEDKIKNCSLNENTVEGGRLRMYINNIPQDSHPISDTLNYSTNTLFIGAGNNPAGSHFYNGTIDEVRIYNRSLSADEIRMQYYSNLRKFNETQWYFYNNVTNLTDGTYTYYAGATNSAGDYNRSEIRTLTLLTASEEESAPQIHPSGSSSGYSSPTPPLNQSQLEEGYAKSLYKGGEIKFQLENENHTLELNNIISKTAIIIVSNGIQIFNLTANEIKKLDFNSDGFYDLQIFAKNITDTSADLILQAIHEKALIEEPVQNNQSTSQEETNNEPFLIPLLESIKQFLLSSWLLIIFIFISGLVLVAGLFLIIRRNLIKKAREIRQNL